MSNGVSYKDDYVSIYNGDCLEFLRQQPDESVDLVITSPPYCMNRAYENPEDDVNTFKENMRLYLKNYIGSLSLEEVFVGKLDIMFQSHV